MLDIGKHPAFIGRDTFQSNAENGGGLLYRWNGSFVAVSLINPKYGVLLALNVHPAHRGHGLGAAVLDFLKPNFARVIDWKTDWFGKCGYQKIGKPKRGITHLTHIMVRRDLIGLVGKLENIRKYRVQHGKPLLPTTSESKKIRNTC